MIHDTGNQVLDSLERRFGGLALPQVLRWIAIFQVLSWGLSLFSRDFIRWIAYSRELILSGQVWRLLSWVVFPVSEGMGGLIFVLFALLLLFFINDSLEHAWGSFRLNVYAFGSILPLALLGLVPGLGIDTMMMSFTFYSCCFLAFATLFPNQELRLLGIIPVKAKWLGWANGAMLAAAVFGSGDAMFLVAVAVTVGLLPWILVFVPAFFSEARQRSESAVRRHRFQQSTSPADGEAFHNCESCGKTDRSDPELTFRVAADGHEYCEECRPPVANRES